MRHVNMLHVTRLYCDPMRAICSVSYIVPMHTRLDLGPDEFHHRLANWHTVNDDMLKRHLGMDVAEPHLQALAQGQHGFIQVKRRGIKRARWHASCVSLLIMPCLHLLAAPHARNRIAPRSTPYLPDHTPTA